MLHTPRDPYRSYSYPPPISRSSSFLSSKSTCAADIASRPPYHPRPRPPLRPRSSTTSSSYSSRYSRPPSAVSYSSNGTSIGGAIATGGEVVIKQDVLNRLKGSLSSAINSVNRRSSSSSSHSFFSLSSSIRCSPTESIAQESNAALVESLDLSNALSNFLTYYLDYYLPYTNLSHYFSTTTLLPPKIPFEIVSTPDSSPTSTRFSYSPPKCIWIRVPSLLPSFDHLSPKLQREAKKQTIPALPSLFGKTAKQDLIDLDGDLWQFEKLGPELDQSFWHLRLKERNDIVVKVVFDQAYGMVGR